MNFKAVRIFEEEGQYIPKIVERKIENLPEGDVVIKVLYSSLNYKDALSCTGNKGVTRNFPHTPGIDAAGIVYSSENPAFKAGEEVFITGYDLGMNTDGGFGEYIRIPSSWIVKKPKNLTLKEAMIYGTAGFTSALSVYELISIVDPEDGPILVTGASGGVGSHTVKFLVKLGYEVVGVVQNEEKRNFLLELGASDTLTRDEFKDTSNKAMLKQTWAGVIDTVGGDPLSTAIRTLKYGGVVTTCGNIAGGNIDNMNVYPFILRGVRLIGIDSVQCPQEKREEVWRLLAESWKGSQLENGIEEVQLNEILGKVQDMLNSRLIGRVILKHSK
ncbi:YhdH/YhfP family quinone oxidoreductase [Psychrilyobacter atlanticus]|uniref:YhdH/YhfP family quinone oxidoreductase n=1 Tax=Psychrilyobacter atlanticus TaxID=271091 RepID=UPI0003FECF47|nr:YhdH/YhfP family quinone oxidoreductase [Psychrilyobacter atlanticus]